MTDGMQSPIDRIIQSTLTPAHIYNIIAVFFVSTVSLFFSFVAITYKIQIPFIGDLSQITIPIFILGYMFLAIDFLMFFAIKSISAIKNVYLRFERGFKIGFICIAIIILMLIGSIYSQDTDFSKRVIGFGLLAILAIVIVVITPILTDHITPKIKQWFKLEEKKGN
jgi:hypothetical protein